jgi:putative PIN family toxin of toxin-antitoxin system
MTCYAVIDTNVLVSALLSSHDDAATVLVVGKLFSGEVIPLFSDEILKEYNDVLRRKKFRFSDDAYLVTGNMKHFPAKPFIVTAKEFLDILNTTNV